MNMLKIEQKHWKMYDLVAGIDEAGRGPLAGPVVSACVIFKKNNLVEGIKDSKKISEKKRNQLFKIIYEKAIDVGVGIVHENKIDNINILQATYLSMKIAIGNMDLKPDIILIDGPRSNIKHYKVEHVINGDNLSQSIAAASIIAKVTRDKIMQEYDKVYPLYKFAKHKGYGTKYHIDTLNTYKATPIHRKSFKIVKQNLPTIQIIKNKSTIEKIGAQLLSSMYIKKNYSICMLDIKLNTLKEFVDYCFLKDNKYTFVKVLTKYNKSIISLGRIDVKYDKEYLKLLDEILKEKDITTNFTFNVICIELIKNNKPKIEIIHSEKFSYN